MVTDKVKAPAKKAAPKKVEETIAVKKPAAKKVATSIPVVSDDERMQMVATAAYYKAEQRGFVGGNPEQDWSDAEREVNELLSK